MPVMRIGAFVFMAKPEILIMGGNDANHRDAEESDMM